MLAWRLTYDIKLGDAGLGVISGTSSGFWLRDSQERLVARSSEEPTSDGVKITVRDCVGALLGTLVRRDGWDGERSFVVTDAAGAVSRTGDVEYRQSPVTLSGTGVGELARLTKDHWFLDRYAVAASPEADARLVAMLFAYNEAADMRESQRRRSDRDHDRGGRDRSPRAP